MDLDDAGDFKKARGILLIYSGIVLALWYFGAKLDTFKLMGTEIKLEHNIDSVWLVLASLNVYFFFRYVQHVPAGGFSFDKGMNEIYDKALSRLACFIKRKAFYKCALDDFRSRSSSQSAGIVAKGHGEILCYQLLKEDEEKGGDRTELSKVSREFRTRMRLTASYRIKEGGNVATYWLHVDMGEYAPGVVFTSVVKAYSIFKGAFFTPWFTNNIGPLLFGAVSSIVAFGKWWLMSYAV